MACDSEARPDPSRSMQVGIFKQAFHKVVPHVGSRLGEPAELSRAFKDDVYWSQLMKEKHPLKYRKRDGQ